tara:strand:- start:608 stop:1009 length:402 start_codon:yes stop_codon:yes gene_type:complete
MTVSESKAKKIEVAFDYNKYLISHDPQTRVVEIPGTDESFEVSVKTISWSKRNQIISKNLHWDSTGNTSFSADGYVRDCLKEMLVEAPWGRTTEAMLLSFDDRLGTALETLVPKAFGEGAEDTIDSGTVKKEL